MSFTLQKKVKRRLKQSILIILALYLMIASALYFFQEKLLFLPTTLEQDYEYQFNHPFEELFLKTDENTVINAIHFKVEKPKGVILYFHGNAGDLTRWGTIAEFFVEKNFDVLIMDYRTYGKSKGTLGESEFYVDAQYCYNYLLKDYAENQITLYGRSLGTGIASYLASKNNPKQLILETPYYSILDVAEHRFPMFPVKKLLKYHFPTYTYLQRSHLPITIIHGTNDEVVPYASAEKLLDLNLGQLNFVTIEGAGHNNLDEFEKYHEIMQMVLD